jgi:type IV pilus assembly protein PilV
MKANRNNAAAYVTGAAAPVGYGTACSLDTSTLANTDLGQWCVALQGATEKFAGGAVGAMAGARGCIETINTNQYLITVAWQGSTAIEAPPASVDCGANLYDANTPASGCTADRCRRTVTTVLSVATLD